MEADDLIGAQKDAESVQEPEGRSKKQDAPRSASEPGDDVPEGTVEEWQDKKRRKPKVKGNQKKQPAAKQHGSDRAAEESAGVKAVVGGVPENQKTEEQAPAFYEKPKADEAPASLPEADNIEKNHWGAEPEQEPGKPSDEQGLEESKWKFVEQEPTDHALMQEASQKGDEVLNETAKKETDLQPEAAAVNKIGYSTLAEEQKEEEDKRQKRKRIIIALAIVIVCILALYALTRVHFGISLTSNALTHASTTAASTSIFATTTTTPVQIRNMTARIGTGSGYNNSTVIVSGFVSPPPKSANSMVLISIANPGGAQVYAADAPVSPSGIFNLTVMVGGANSWSDGTYSATSNYYGASGMTTFYFAAANVMASNSIEATIVNELCNVYLTVHSVIFLLGIMLVVLGAVIYAFAHVMPGQHKGQIQTYGMGIIIGGVIGVLIAVLAPYILRMIANNALPIAWCVSKSIV